MNTYVIRVRMPRGGELKVRIQANTRFDAESMAAMQTGGVVLGGYQVTD
jgi:hypothetical protein